MINENRTATENDENGKLFCSPRLVIQPNASRRGQNEYYAGVKDQLKTCFSQLRLCLSQLYVSSKTINFKQ